MVWKNGLSRYILGMLGGLLLAAVAIAGFNYVVNPFGIWSPPNVQKGRVYHLARIDSVRLVKAYDLLRGCPDHVITGMSSVVWGIDPETYPVPGKQLYNGGIVGSSIEEQFGYIRTFLHQCPNISRVYLDVNFESFHECRPPAPDFRVERLMRDSVSPKDMFFTLVSRYATVQSLNSLHLGRDRTHAIHDDGDGFHRWLISPDYSHVFRAYISSAGLTSCRLLDLQINALRDMNEYLRNLGVEVVFYFAPIHAYLHYARRYNSALSVSGAELQDQLKRAVAEIAPFYDFNGALSVTGESIYNGRLFFDQIHYQPRLGAMIMARLNEISLEDMPDHFGDLVTLETVDEHLDRFKRLIDTWVEENPTDADFIRNHYQNLPQNAGPAAGSIRSKDAF